MLVSLCTHFSCQSRCMPSPDLGSLQPLYMHALSESCACRHYFKHEAASTEHVMLSCVHVMLSNNFRAKMAVQMLETFSGLAIGQMVAERATLVMRMSKIEDWDIVAASHKTGQLCQYMMPLC